MANYTQKEMFTALQDAISRIDDFSITIADTSYDGNEIVNFLQSRIDQLSKRTVRTGETKKQKENAPIKDAIIVTLNNSDKGMTVKEIIVALNMEGLTSQKVSALLSQLRKAGTVKREYDKKVAYFSIGSEDGE